MVPNDNDDDDDGEKDLAEQLEEALDEDLPGAALNNTENPPEVVDTWFADANTVERMNAMRAWFFYRFQGPEQDLPYNSREGGYLWIRGGPHLAEDMLRDRFEGRATDDEIRVVVDSIESDGNTDWTPIDYGQFRDYEGDFSFEVEAAQEPVQGLQQRMAELEQLLALPGGETLIRLLYASVITALEVYLSDLTLYWVKNDPAVLRRFVQTTEHYRQLAFPMSSIFAKMEKIEHEAERFLRGLVWHRLDQVAPILEKTLKVKAPDTTVLMAAIVKRHHIIHRAGLTPEGEQVAVSAADVRELRQQALAFATSIQGQLSNGS